MAKERIKDFKEMTYVTFSFNPLTQKYIGIIYKSQVIILPSLTQFGRGVVAQHRQEDDF